MTALANPILFNSGTGSDTAASGSGSSSVVSGTGASTNNTTTVDLSADTPDLSGVAAGDLMWVDSTAGRQFSVIASVDDGADTVTVDDTYTQTEGTRNWGIGGKRATFDDADSRLLFADTKTSWVITTETDQNITGSALAFSGEGTVQGDSVSTHRTISQSANAAIFIASTSSTAKAIKNLKLENTNGTKTSADGITKAVSAVVLIQNCILGDVTNQLKTGYSGTISSTSEANHTTLVDCDINNCTGAGIDISGVGIVTVRDCWIHDNGIEGIDGNSAKLSVTGCLIVDNTADGIRTRALNPKTISNNTFHSNGGDGMDLTMSAGDLQGIIINNNFTANTGYGIRSSASNNHDASLVDYNNYGTGATANTAGDVLGFTKGSNSINVDPGYTSTGSDDFSVGTSVKALGFPDTARTIGANQSGTTTFVDIGGAQREEAGGGGGGGNYIIGG